MGLIEKLTNIANGFRASRGTTTKYTLEEMAILAAEPVGGGVGGGAEDLDTELTEQEGLIEQLMTILEGKASGGGGEPMEMVATFADGTTKTYIIYGEAAE